jgi:hypothetical protein
MNPVGVEPFISGGTATSVTLPSYLPWAELILLAMTIVLGAMLYVRSRQTRQLLLVLASMLFGVDVLLWLSFSTPAAASSWALFQIAQPVSQAQGWFRPLGSLFLTAYVLIQLLCSPRPHVR